MLRFFYKSKIQKATITRTNLDYAGSIGIDQRLLEAADILPNEKVQVLNLETGARFETYVIKEKPDSGTICLYGPAARLGEVGQRLFIISYCLATPEEINNIVSKVIIVDQNNKIVKEEEKNV
ncbi:aspartate 1-decarboxylase [Candidatus Omnitrophota bacterium]